MENSFYRLISDSASPSAKVRAPRVIDLTNEVDFEDFEVISLVEDDQVPNGSGSESIEKGEPPQKRLRVVDEAKKQGDVKPKEKEVGTKQQPHYPRAVEYRPRHDWNEEMEGAQESVQEVEQLILNMRMQGQLRLLWIRQLDSMDLSLQQLTLDFEDTTASEACTLCPDPEQPLTVIQLCGHVVCAKCCDKAGRRCPVCSTNYFMTTNLPF